MMSTTCSDNLPEDAIIEILARLPVKTLMRLRYVCKSWHNLFQNQSFCLRQLRLCSYDDAHLVVSYLPFVGQCFTISLFRDETLETLPLHDLTPDRPVDAFDYGIYGGIVFLTGRPNHLITLWNPVIREHRTLPKCSIVFPGYKERLHTSMGFGLDPFSDDLKLILITEMQNVRNEYLSIYRVAIFSLNTNSWRSIEGIACIDHNIEREHDSTYLDGVCYWKAYGKDDNEFVLSFHMGDEIFQEIERPAGITVFMKTVIGSYNEFLAYLSSYWKDGSIGIWVRKETHWSKHLHINLSDVLWPLGFWKKEFFIIESNHQQVRLFDPSTEKMTDLVEDAINYRIHKYKPSLIALKQEEPKMDDDFDIPWHILGVDTRFWLKV